MIQYGVHFDLPEGDESRRKPGSPATGRGFESGSLQRRSHVRTALHQVKGLTMMTNSQYNGWRFEDVRLDK